MEHGFLPGELERRRPVWEALSTLFLDTDVAILRPSRARTLAASPFTLGELETILIEEVDPVCRPNLRSIAGEWAGFDATWLEREICRRRISRRRRLLRLDGGGMTADVAEEWARTRVAIDALRSAVNQAPTTRNEWRRDDYTISTDRRRLDFDVIHGLLATSYWAPERSRERIVRSVEHSLPFGLYHGVTQVGFARVVTDYVVIAFLADVFVVDSHRGKGLGKWLVEVATTFPELQRVRRWMLGTRDAHGLYREVGFTDPKPGVLMERLDPESDRER